MTPNTTYYLRAYATNKKGTSYGLQQTFITKSLVITTKLITDTTANSAKCGGLIAITGDSSNIIARGVCWNTMPNPTVENYKTTDGNGIGNFNSSLTGLSANTTYFVKAYITNSGGTYYGNEISFTTLDGIIKLNTLVVSLITTSTSSSGGLITNDGGAEISSRGVCWSTTSLPTTVNSRTSDGSGTGLFTSSITGLSPSTTYYVRAYATNSVGTVYGSELSFTTFFEVTNPTTGKTWLDRNLGAYRAATSSNDNEAFGDLYQWGRGTDGHEKRNSGTTTSLSISYTPGHGNFILSSSSPNDWLITQNTNLWQFESGINNPCPPGYRLPTQAELDAERVSWNINNATGAFESFLKLTVAGYRYSGGSLNTVGTSGAYWSSTVNGTSSWYLYFGSNNASMSYTNRGVGGSVRCIKK